MAQYLSPGVYVEEVPSSIKAIAGVSTSTAAFIGIVPDSITVPVSSTLIRDEKVGKGDGTTTVFNLPRYPVEETAGTFQVRVDGTPTAATLKNDDAGHVSTLTFGTAPKSGSAITGDFVHDYTKISPHLAAAGTPVLCTTFSDFRESFGDFSLMPVSAASPTPCTASSTTAAGAAIVVRVDQRHGLRAMPSRPVCRDRRDRFVAMPGNTDAAVVCHRHALRRPSPTASPSWTAREQQRYDDKLTDLFDPPNGSVARQEHQLRCLVFPWIKVFDPATKRRTRSATADDCVPPSGHLAGIYARVDTERGVHKAPANEVVRGALDVTQPLSKARAGRPQPAGRQRASASSTATSSSGARARGRRRQRRPQVHQRPAHPAVPARVDRRGHPVGRVRAQHARRCGRRSPATSPPS